MYIHIHNWTLLSHKKQWSFAIYSNMDDHGGYYAKWSKTNAVGYHLYVESKKYNEQVNI